MFHRIRRGLESRPWTELLIPALLCALLVGQLLFSVRQLSMTADEVTHITSGYRYLKCGDLTVSPDHPPLARIVAALPLLPMDLDVTCAPFKGDVEELATAVLNWLSQQDWRSALARARLAVSVFALGLCLLVWLVARRMFDLATAVTATALLAFEPNLLAFGALVLTDVPVTCMLLFAVYGFYLWVGNRSAPFLLLTGLATGLTLLAKHSGVVVLPILCALAVVDALLHYAGPRLTLHAALRNLRALLLICAVAFGTVWAGYGMRFAAYPGTVQFQGTSPDATSNSARVLFALKSYHVLPEAYLEGLAGALSISSESGAVFLAGKIYPHAPWFSVPFYLLIRSTSAMLALFLLAAVGMSIVLRQRRREVLFLLVPAGVFLAVCLSASNVNIRYLLPVLPFLLIAIAAGCVELARRVRWVRYAVPCLTILHAVSSLLVYPNYLSYANEFWGGPAKAYQYLPQVDIGQAYPETKAYLEKHPAEQCWLLTTWRWDPRLYGVPCQPFGNYLRNQIPPRVQGTVIVSGTLLADALLQGEVAAPFKNLTPKEKIGGSALLVYEGDFDTRLAAAMSERMLMLDAYSVGQLSVALMHGKQSVAMAPDSGLARGALCVLLTETGQLDSGLEECSRARSLFLRDPFREDPLRKKYSDIVESSLVQLRAQYRAVYGRDAPLAPPEPHPDSR